MELQIYGITDRAKPAQGSHLVAQNSTTLQKGATTTKHFRQKTDKEHSCLLIEMVCSMNHNLRKVCKKVNNINRGY